MTDITNSQVKTLKICCFMWYDKNMEKYGDVAYDINKMYCDKYGYDIIRSSERTYKNRTPHWERLPLMLKHINKYDYIIWIDADAHFYVDSPPITNVIDKHPEKLFILSGDIDEPQYNLKCVVNSGFFIIKNAPQSHVILKEWAYSDELYKARYGFSVCGVNGVYQDQGVLRLMLDKNLFGMKDNSIVINYGILEFFPGVNPAQFPNARYEIFPEEYDLNRKPYVCHWSKFNSAGRYDRSKKYFDYLMSKKSK